MGASEPFSPHRFSRYARDLEQAIWAMRFKVTEPTFFLHEERKPGDTLEHPVGPFRYEPGAGGLKRTAQFEEIKMTDAPANKFDGPSVGITGIQSGVFEAKMAEMKKKLADRLNGGLAKMDIAAEAGAVKLEAAVDGIVAKVDKEIEDKLQEFAQFSNGGPV